MGAKNRVRIGLSYRPARLHRLAEAIPWNRFLGSVKVLQIPALVARALVQLRISASMQSNSSLCIIFREDCYLSFLGHQFSAGIFKQSMGAWNRVGLGFVAPARQGTRPGGINSLELILWLCAGFWGWRPVQEFSLELILGLLKSFKIRAQIRHP